MAGAVAYRSGIALCDSRTGTRHDYRRRSGVAATEILAPEHAPAWVYDREELWRQVEANERRADAQLAREIEIALPRELTAPQQLDLVREFCQTEFVSRGMVADVSIHAKPGNPHAHILLTMRHLTPEGFGLKAREWNDRAFLVRLREAWADLVNQALTLAGSSARVDHRTLSAQGIEKAPGRHHGPASRGMIRRGAESDRLTSKELTHENPPQPRPTRRRWAEPTTGPRLGPQIQPGSRRR
jgi:ATP-dependent exoDNAse (exonuclease V) alpha subunit